MTCSTVLPKYNKRLVVEIEVWVSHRSENSIMHVSDPPDKEWRACVRHSNGAMEWQWCKTFDDAVAWCERYSSNAAVEARRNAVASDGLLAEESKGEKE